MEKNLTISIVALIVALASITSLTFAISALKPMQVVGEEEEYNLLTVTGFGKVEAKPDLAVLRLTVETIEDTASKAMEVQAEKMTSVIGALKKIGVKEDQFRTTDINLYPVYSYDKEREIVGYKASNTIILTLSTEDQEFIGRAIDVGVEAGVNNLDISFQFSDSVYNNLKKQAISKATEDAEQKAEAATSPLNLKILGVKDVKIESYYAPWRGFDIKADEYGTPIYVGTSQVTATVTISFIIG